MQQPAVFTGLSAFPLTPMNESQVDEAAFARLLERLLVARVDSICVLGSTGSYAYLSRAERARVVQLAVQQADKVPVIAGIGALRTRDVLALAEDAQALGASALLLPPMSYQRLTHEEVFALYATVSRAISVPLCVYDNPATTHFEFTDELHGRIAQLPNVASIKIPGVPADADAARQRVTRLRALLPAHVTVGVSGDAFSALGLNAGCEAWYSVIGGLFPKEALHITRAAQAGEAERAVRLAAHLEPLWTLMRQHGSLRVVATAAEWLGLVQSPCLPLPVQSLQGDARQQVWDALDALQLA